jgi:hypothetical protein
VYSDRRGFFTTTRWHFLQTTVTDAASMLARSNGAALSSISATALLTPPGIFGQALHRIFEGVVNRDV